MHKTIKNYKDVQSLLENKVPENFYIDYKSDLNLINDKNKLAFLKDICSFSNASGGQIIYGIQEKNGIPEMLVGIEIDPDKEKLRILDIIRNGLEPVIPEVDIEIFETSEHKQVLVIRIEKSWKAPHWVSFNNHHKFYGRRANGNYELSYIEIKEQFLKMLNIKDRIQEFRKDRISKIIKGDGLIDNPPQNPRMVLHIIPFASFAAGVEYDVLKLKKLQKEEKFSQAFSPLCRIGGYKTTINQDGFMTINNKGIGCSELHSYTTFMRNGIIEAVSSCTVSSREIHVGELERMLLNQQYITILKELSIDLPVYILLTLIDVSECFLAICSNVKFEHFLSVAQNYIDEDVFFEEHILESLDTPIEEFFKPLFNRLWNVWGYDRCFHYNENGTYRKDLIFV